MGRDGNRDAVDDDGESRGVMERVNLEPMRRASVSLSEFEKIFGHPVLDVVQAGDKGGGRE